MYPSYGSNFPFCYLFVLFFYLYSPLGTPSWPNSTPTSGGVLLYSMGLGVGGWDRWGGSSSSMGKSSGDGGGGGRGDGGGGGGEEGGRVPLFSSPPLSPYHWTAGPATGQQGLFFCVFWRTFSGTALKIVRGGPQQRCHHPHPHHQQQQEQEPQEPQRQQVPLQWRWGRRRRVLPPCGP